MPSPIEHLCTLHLQIRSQSQEGSNDEPHLRLEQPVELSKAVALRDGHQMECVCVLCQKPVFTSTRRRFSPCVRAQIVVGIVRN